MAGSVDAAGDTLDQGSIRLEHAEVSAPTLVAGGVIEPGDLTDGVAAALPELSADLAG